MGPEDLVVIVVFETEKLGGLYVGEIGIYNLGQYVVTSCNLLPHHGHFTQFAGNRYF
jgi:hypothetical protein